MSEPTLDLPKAYMDAAIAEWLGYGRGNVVFSDTAWTTDQAASINLRRQSALRMVYNTEPFPDVGVPAAYEWSFLRPVAEVVLESGAKFVTLPDDFGGSDGKVYLVGSNRAFCPIPIAGTRVRMNEAQFPDRTGQPVLADFEPVKGTTPNAGQRWRLRVFPTADQAYTLALTYIVAQDDLTAAMPRSPAGPVHAETLRAAGVRAAEQFIRGGDTPDVLAAYKGCLAASVAADRKFKVQWAGYVGDNSDAITRLRAQKWRTAFNPVTYLGQSLE